MAEAQDQVVTPQEPSMEEILASIRKIISDDNQTATAPAPADETKTSASQDDVLELTQMVQDDGSIVDVKSLKTEPAVVAAEEIVAVSPPTPEPIVVQTPTVPVPAKPLVSETVVSSTASALTALANTVEIERLSSAPQGGMHLGNGSRTLEDMVIELMRPLLKDWLDKNLPATVDRLVQKEIERIARKSQN